MYINGGQMKHYKFIQDSYANLKGHYSDTILDYSPWTSLIGKKNIYSEEEIMLLPIDDGLKLKILALPDGKFTKILSRSSSLDLYIQAVPQILAQKNAEVLSLKERIKEITAEIEKNNKALELEKKSIEKQILEIRKDMNS